MTPYEEELIPDHSYHIFNRAIGNEKLFRNELNYGFFIKRMKKYIIPIAEIFSYSLLPNHFHFFLRIRPLRDIGKLYRLIKKKALAEHDNKLISEFIMERFSNMCNSYAKSFNKVYNRKGKLFMDHLKRIEISDEGSFSKIIHYIHANAVQHGYCDRISDWKHSSYLAMLSTGKTDLLRNEVLDWFGGREGYIKFHHQPILPKSDFDMFE